MAGDKDRAIKALEDRIDRIDTSEDQLRSRLIASLVFIYLVCGDLPQARAEAERLQRVAKRLGIRNTEGWSDYFLGSADLHTGESATALVHFANAVDQQYVFESMPAIDSFAGLALTLQLLRRDDEASETVDRLREFAGELNERQYLNAADSCRARISLLRGDTRSAATWAKSFNERPGPSSSFMWLEVPSITQARVLISVGSKRSLEKATALLAEIRQVSEACRFTCQTIEVAVLQSLSLEKQGRTDEALAAVTEAVALAEPGGWVRPFVELGEPMAELLRRLSTRNVAVEFVDRLLAAFPERQPEAAPDGSDAGSTLQPVSHSSRLKAGRQPVPSSQSAGSESGIQPLMEPLTNRELDVLELLAERLYDKEIARELSISVWTVKSHVKHIFEKLHVTGRRQAVLKAEELGLLKGK
jgi:LuxR family maltose regulon positive regulatory protein